MVCFSQWVCCIWYIRSSSRPHQTKTVHQQNNNNNNIIKHRIQWQIGYILYYVYVIHANYAYNTLIAQMHQTSFPFPQPNSSNSIFMQNRFHSVFFSLACRFRNVVMCNTRKYTNTHIKYISVESKSVVCRRCMCLWTCVCIRDKLYENHAVPTSKHYTHNRMSTTWLSLANVAMKYIHSSSSSSDSKNECDFGPGEWA